MASNYLDLQQASKRRKSIWYVAIPVGIVVLGAIICATAVLVISKKNKANVESASDNVEDEAMPLPFKRELKVSTDVVLEGNDVLIATTLMSRCSAWPSSVKPSLQYTQSIAAAVTKVQEHLSLTADGVFGAQTANATLQSYSDDSFVDDGSIRASDYGAKYKIYIPVHSDAQRDIETMAQLLDAENNVLMSFTARTHGSSNPPTETWPNYDNAVGLNQFTSNGNTPTGLGYLDLNSAEPPDVQASFGPYPVHRVVSGIAFKGASNNMDLLLQPDSTNMRSGILVHTGEWPDWKDGDQMPNSNGCIKVYPDDLQRINAIVMEQLGVTVNNNTFSGKNYPFKPQGIISIASI